LWGVFFVVVWCLGLGWCCCFWGWCVVGVVWGVGFVGLFVVGVVFLCVFLLVLWFVFCFGLWGWVFWFWVGLVVGCVVWWLVLLLLLVGVVVWGLLWFLVVVWVWVWFVVVGGVGGDTLWLGFVVEG
ncbi:hypothetical protein, partial [Pseudomonas syringae group genomosp. 7]|uniref:hypothetical protein n=1 Tax=Pseudomonas syringae group genomosp. 7 TaxID=251699 RepID=UPI00376F8A83